MKNTFGSAVSLTIFGESHGPAIGAVLDGLAAGLPVEEQFIAECMDRRRARGDGLSTSRTEPDRVEILSGVLDGHTTGTPVTLIVRNTNTRSGDYARTAALLRPGHADYTAWAKYEGFQDARGGGHFSGRITAASVAAGAICQQVLAGLGIQVYTHIARCAGISDAALPADGTLPAPAAPGHFSLVDPGRETAMQEAIRAAGAAGDSVGGILETVVTGLPAGVGEPFFDSVESELSHLMFSCFRLGRTSLERFSCCASHFIELVGNKCRLDFEAPPWAALTGRMCWITWKRHRRRTPSGSRNCSRSWRPRRKSGASYPPKSRSRRSSWPSSAGTEIS